MSAISKSFNLDLKRLNASGPLNTIITICIPILYTLMFGVLLSDGSSGPPSDTRMSALVGIIVSGSVVFASYPFMYEVQNDHLRINGIIPVSRASQVSSRFLLTGAIDVMAVAVLLICIVIEYLIGATVSFSDVLGTVGLMLLISIIVQSVLMPVLYRFTTVKMFQFLTLGFLVGFAIIGVVGLLLNKYGLLEPLVNALIPVFTSVPTATAMGIGVAVAAVAISYACSKHIYTTKEF